MEVGGGGGGGEGGDELGGDEAGALGLVKRGSDMGSEIDTMAEFFGGTGPGPAL